VIAAVGDVAEQLAELRPELPHWNDLRHDGRVYRIAYTELVWRDPWLPGSVGESRFRG
jgi:hypothetical protein